VVRVGRRGARTKVNSRSVSSPAAEQRGVLPAEAERYLQPTIRDLMPDPSTLTAMDAAADDLLSRGYLPAVVGGSGSSFAYAGASWKEIRLP